MKITDPVCKMTIEEEDATATSSHGGKTYRFCSLHCKEKFNRNPESYIGGDTTGKKWICAPDGRYKDFRVWFQRSFFGIASFPDDGIRKFTALLKKATERLYLAKTSGRNR